jgi:hypothetical protein
MRCSMTKDKIRRFLVAMDDTDAPECGGTGKLAQKLAEEIAVNSYGKCSGISRHQLLVHPEVPYTSHNSAMCFEVMSEKTNFQKIIDFGKRFLEKESEKGSDPGFCVALSDNGLDWAALMDFGLKTKNHLVSKTEALDLAASNEISLSEHGGTGQGVVGALAALGLRANGNDGRFRGWYRFGEPGDTVTAKVMEHHPGVDEVQTDCGVNLNPHETILMGVDRIKTVVKSGRRTVVVEKTDPGAAANWKTLERKTIRKY